MTELAAWLHQVRSKAVNDFEVEMQIRHHFGIQTGHMDLYRGDIVRPVE